MRYLYLLIMGLIVWWAVQVQTWDFPTFMTGLFAGVLLALFANAVRRG